MAKEFKKSYMHPTRRKLADMVQTGEYDKSIYSSLSNTDSKREDNKTREVGETWTDSKGVEWEQRKGYKVKKSKLSDTMSEVRKYLEELNTCSHENCQKKGKYGPTDKKLIQQTGYCSDCLAHLEHQIRLDGMYIPYENYRVMTNMIKEGEAMLNKMKEAYVEAKQEYEFVDAEGKTQTWKMEKNVDELKEEISEDIQRIEREIDVVKSKREEVYELLKDKKYRLIEELRKYHIGKEHDTGNKL